MFSIFTALLITDGLSNVNAEDTIPQAQLAKDAGIHMFAIGIGRFDAWEIEGIASEPTDKNAFIIDDFSKLYNVSTGILDSICRGRKINWPQEIW